MGELNVLLKDSEKHSAVRKDEAPLHAAAWADPEHVVLSERSWSPKDKHCMVSLTMKYGD